MGPSIDGSIPIFNLLTFLNCLFLFLLPTPRPASSFFFFLNDPAPPEIYPLPLPAPLPISARKRNDPVPLAADDPRRARLLHRRRSVHRARGPVIAAFEREWPSAEQTADDVDRLGEPGQPFTRRREGQAYGLVLGCIPAGAETHVEPAAADAVERGERFGEHGCRPQRLARDERAEPGTGDRASQRGQGDDR